jgi:P pilus assembly chaperone PapD
MAAVAAIGGLGMLAPVASATSISVTPAHLIIPGNGRASLTVTNTGSEAETFSLRIGNYDLRPDGRVRIDPRLTPGRSARDWLRTSPPQIRLGPGQETTVTITSRPARSATPGDHQALLLVTSLPKAAVRSRVAVRSQVGVGVIARVPGPFVRRIAVARPFVVRSGARRAVRLRLTNRGNINERFARGQIAVTLRRRGRVLARLVARPQSVLPGTKGVVSIPYRGRISGRVTVVATVRLARPAQAGPGIASTPTPIVRRATVRL